ncbi:MAG: serine/threonine protein kinase, partial [Victivallales bacterium]|nr:serine/threonine protein kinase [Victivallales bacterium]
MPEDQTKNEPVADSNEQSAKPTESSPSDTSVSSEVKKMGIPKPIPRGGSTTALPEDEPLSEDTIHIDRSTIIDTQASSQDELDPQKRLKIFCYNCGQKLDLTDMTPFSKINCPSCSSEIIVPRWFDNYLLEELCGVGGMAVVYRGLDLALDREVAIKILNRESAESPGQNKLFLHEARTVATLNHFAILPIYTCGEYEGQAYFVMQYMSGGSLDVEIANAKGEGLLVDEACKWLKDIAEGLDNAKRHGIIHHDIKPGNFMLDSERNAKIGDFGISQALHDKSSEELAKLAASWGSPQYVSPEKIETGVESHLGDIYSLGATFYHVLT